MLGAPADDTSRASPSASATAPSGPTGTIEVRAFDLGFEPAMVHVDAPGTYAVTFINDGGVLHDLTFADGTKISAEAHTVATGEVTIPAEGLTFICSVPGHADAGMRGEVMVAATGEPGASASPDASMTAEEMADVDAARTGQFPAETEGKGNQVLEPTILADGTKQWELTASVIQWETEPGMSVEAYAYNGTVPGPQLRAEGGRSDPDRPAQRAAGADDDPLRTACSSRTRWTACRSSASRRSCPASRSPTSTPSATRARTCTTATSWPITRCRWACWAPSS